MPGMRGSKPRLLALPLAFLLVLLAACNGTAVVTLTSTPSTDTFLAYRVGLASVQLQTSNGRSNLKVLPTEMTVDLTKLTDLSEVLGSALVAKGTYTTAVITLDYSAAQIIIDDGSLAGVVLTPVGTNGQPLSQVTLTLDLDPSNPFRIAAKQTARLALDLDLAASNAVNLTAKTVTVTPMISASALSIDTKQVRIRGPLVRADTTNLFFTMGVTPFGGLVSGLGQLAVEPSDATTYEVDGNASTGTTGLTQLAGLAANSFTVAFGTLNTTTTATTTTTTALASTNVSFAATQVLAGSSVQGSGLDRVSGIVSARSGNTLTIEGGTLIANDGSNTFLPATTIVNVGANTQVTVFGQGTIDLHSPQEISIGSAIDAFGTASASSAGAVTLDASAGRVRMDSSTAAGLVTVQGSASLSLGLVSLGGRAISAFDFVGSGADPAQYSVATEALDLTNAIVGAPVVISGLPSSFGVTSPNFTATTLLDPTTIQALIVIDWGSGTAAPFTTFDSSAITLDVRNTSIGTRHEILLGAQAINLVGLGSDPVITPNTTNSSNFAIGHSASAIVETFNTYADFITQLQAELNGSALATEMTSVGQYTASTFAFSATGITIILNN
jgi:Domain of unknown function (DUF4382)